MPDLTDTIVAEYNHQLRLIGILCIVLITVSLVAGASSFVYLGTPLGESIENTLVALTLGGGSINVTSYSRPIVVALSLAGILLVSLVVALVTISVQKDASLRVSRAIFRKELDLVHEQDKRNKTQKDP